MKKSILLSILMLFTLCLTTNAQEVSKDTSKYVLKGTTFKSNDSVSNSKAEEIKTKYIYEDKKGNVFPIFLSKSGKAFIWRESQKTGKRYRRYLPEIGRKINPKAYVDKKV